MVGGGGINHPLRAGEVLPPRGRQVGTKGFWLGMLCFFDGFLGGDGGIGKGEEQPGRDI